MHIEKNAPENHKKKQERDQKLAAELAKQKEATKKEMAVKKQYYLDQGKKHWEEFSNEQSNLVKAKREAKASNSLFVEEEPKYFLVTRIKGLNKVPPKEKKILQLFRLRQLHNAVLIRNNKASMTMLRRIEQYVTYGKPTHSVIRALVYKRGYAKLNKQRIPLTSNLIIEEGLGQFGIKCVEDLIHELYTCGPHFKQANNFLWPFKLNSPTGGLQAKRHPYLNMGDFGPREEYINDFIRRML